MVKSSRQNTSSPPSLNEGTSSRVNMLNTYSWHLTHASSLKAYLALLVFSRWNLYKHSSLCHLLPFAYFLVEYSILLSERLLNKDLLHPDFLSSSQCLTYTSLAKYIMRSRISSLSILVTRFLSCWQYAIGPSHNLWRHRVGIGVAKMNQGKFLNAMNRVNPIIGQHKIPNSKRQLTKN